jgi:predicted kinase
VGKTTLAARLAKDLSLPLIGKDMLKEFLFDQVGSTTLEDSRFLGKVSVKMLYALLKEYIASDKSLIVENAFYAEFARPEITDLLGDRPIDVIEIYCETTETIRHGRISSRIADGSRHAGHHDSMSYLEISPSTYAPLAIGTVLHYDTTTDDAAAYAALCAKLKA